jgi:hypothetical protein
MTRRRLADRSDVEYLPERFVVRGPNGRRLP